MTRSPAATPIARRASAGSVICPYDAMVATVIEPPT
jgi:hypothetical protein